MLNFNVNKVTIYHFYSNYIVYTFVPNYLSFGGVFPYFLALFRLPGSESGIHIRIQAAIECGSVSETLPATKPITVLSTHHVLYITITTKTLLPTILLFLSAQYR
jgi:hypothetical protein